MRFTTRISMALVALAAAGTAFTGCGGSGSSGSGSTVAPSTSGTAPTTSGTAPTTSGSTTGPRLSSVSFVDVDQNEMVSKGDRLVAAFAGELTPIGSSLSPAAEFHLAVNGDSFGQGAVIVMGQRSNEVEVVLGDGATLLVSDTYSLGMHAPGSASGINVSSFSGGGLKGTDGGRVQPAAATLDIGGSLQPGFRPAASLNHARGGHTAVLLDDGRVLAVGGVSAQGDYVAEAELFDPVTNTWTRVSDLSGDAGKMKRGKIEVRMVDAAAVKLNDGRVLICGGFGIEKKGLFGFGKEKVDTLESAFIFDPLTNSFQQTGDLKYSRHSHTATLMDDGRVLISGGYNDSFWRKHKTQAPFELFDPAKNAFETEGSFFSKFKSKEPRMNHTATPIEGGTGILLAGGNGYTGGGLFGLIKPKLKMNQGSEVVRQTTTDAAGDLNAARMDHDAALVAPRNVLIAGGHDPSGPIAMLELYDEATAQWTAVGDLATARSGAKIAVDRTQALIVGGFDGTAEVATVEVFDASTKALSSTTYQLGTARNACTVTRLKDGRILVVGGMTGGSIQALDGQAVASAEIFSRQ